MEAVGQDLTQVAPNRRVLLLPHCLRPSETCLGKYTKEGLQCPEDCLEKCVIHRFRQEALRLGYAGVCVAAGGAMALRFVKQHQPRGIVAVACAQELALGVEGVKQMSQEGLDPAIIIIPLHKDGCIDTEVDAQEVLRTINLMPK
ncbi:MAG: DUF116 domain-containing protein [Chloroflexi bacterium]|nr:DUF116 domain-containing protein [Chloroflexota bacterium]